MSGETLIVPTGRANLASVVAGLERAGSSTRLAEDRRQVRDAARVVLPGVGAFGAGMAAIDRLGFRDELVRRIEQGRPTLAICLGMQLLCEKSEESPGVEGLGVIPGSVGRFQGDVRVPQLGWNEVAAGSSNSYLDSGWAYFANSYRLDTTPEGWAAATTVYGDTFVSALEKGDVLACQFHPELSSGYGAGVLERWLAGTGGSR